MTDRSPIPGVSSFLDRHGTRRWRFRKAGVTYQLGTDYGSPDFLRRLAMEQAAPAPAPEHREVATGSLEQLIRSWLRSPEFQRLGPTTRKTYTGVAQRVRPAPRMYGGRGSPGLGSQSDRPSKQALTRTWQPVGE